MSQSSSVTIVGEHTTAEVLGLTRNELEDSAYDQIQDMVDHPAFQNTIKVMPDTHRGAGSVIGFTMQLGDRVAPNVVGVDIGCGLIATKLSDRVDELELTHEEIDERVRDRVPMGWGEEGVKAPDRGWYHVKEDFPWETVNDRLRGFIELVDGPYVGELRDFYEDGGYDIDYFKELVNERSGRNSRFDMNTAIAQVGTLGSGNHFIELSESEQTGETWVVIHSGSRGLGSNTAEYWQREAIKYRDERAETARQKLGEFPSEYVKFDLDSVSDVDLLDWLHGGMGEDFVNYEAITERERERVRKQLKQAIPDESLPHPDDSLDYLEGEEVAGYLIDMLFCQEYAVENRRMMARETADVIGSSVVEEIHARHNIVDFRDGVIRKGATRAYEGERVVIPFNMRDGTLVVEGKSNESWNCSVCHGAGRVMSRREAFEELSETGLREQMLSEGAYATEYPVDESPGAYKDTALIEEAISPTANVVDRLRVVHNFKAPST